MKGSKATLKSLLGVVWPQVVRTLPGVFLQLCGMVLGSFVVPLMSAKVLDIRGLERKKKKEEDLGIVESTLLSGVVIIFCLQLLGSGLRALERLVLEGQWQRAKSEVEGMLFQHLIRLDATFYSRSQVGELLAALSNPGLSYFCAEALPHAVKGLTALIGGGVAMMYTQSTLAIVAMSTAPVLFIIQKIRARKSRKAARRIDKARAHAHAFAAESLRAASTVQVHAAEGIEIARHKKALDKAIFAAHKAAKDDVVIASSADACVAVGDAIFLYFAATCVANGEISIGQFAAFRSALSQYQRGLRELTRTANKLNLSYGQASRFLALLFQTDSALPDTGLRDCDKDIAPELVLDNVFFRYTETTPHYVLTNCSLTARAGETTALVGKSGSGKSTIGKLLLRLYDPERGTVRADTIPLPNFMLSEHRRRFGIVDQEPSLFNRSVFANIAYGLSDDEYDLKERVIASARRSAIHDVILALPQGYETLLGEGASRLSGGERQRLALARAVVRNPRCLLLDEATSSLDIVSERLVQDALEACPYQCTTVVIAHRLSTIVAADAIIVLDQGTVLEHGTHAQLLANPKGAYSDMYRAYVTDRASLRDTAAVSAIGAASRSHPLLTALSKEEDIQIEEEENNDADDDNEQHSPSSKAGDPFLSASSSLAADKKHHPESASSASGDEEAEDDDAEHLSGSFID